MPLGRLIHTYDDTAVALWRTNGEEGLKIARAAGAKESWTGTAIPTSHLHGGTIMGTGAANSVVNNWTANYPGNTGFTHYDHFDIRGIDTRVPPQLLEDIALQVHVVFH